MNINVILDPTARLNFTESTKDEGEKEKQVGTDAVDEDIEIIAAIKAAETRTKQKEVQ